MNLQIQHQEINDEQRLSLSGEIDAYTAPELRETLIPLLKKEGEIVVVDLSQVSYMDSTGLGIFVAGLKTSKEYHSHLKLVGLTERVGRLFRITGLSEVMNVDKPIKGAR